MRSIITMIFAAVALAGCGPMQEASAMEIQPAVEPTSTDVAMPALPNFGPAPEISNQVWINSDHPLRLQDLRGKVVLLEMWTFGCYNCKNVIPYLKEWHRAYADQGLVIIGNHYPEFSFERDLDNLKAAVIDLGIEYSVAQDNDRATWGAYNNRYWPTLYLIDKHSDIRYTHIGEGQYVETEAAIQSLLAEDYP